ncbi:MAG: hypothetical protein Q8R55_03345 [Candidatus Taylorbacteria bacterium]|nr:hypothetical protein [Candidatus Taylorbacteria bacterium]
MQDAPKENNCYQRYQELGGIINEKDYGSALTKAKNTTTLAIALIKGLRVIAEFAGIELHNAKDSIDPRTILYGILRTDTKPEGVQDHHSQMSDQRLFAEALRMLGDTDALNKLVDAHHKVGTYCPICLKVVASGEECR